MDSCSAMDCPSVHWMQTIGELHFPVSSATTKHCTAVLCLSTTLYRHMESCSAMDCPSVHWMQTIGELHFPVSSATTKHSLMPTGTKDTLNPVTVQMFLLLPASRRQSSSHQLSTSLTHFKITYYNFLTKTTARRAARLKRFKNLCFIAEQYENLKFHK